MESNKKLADIPKTSVYLFYKFFSLTQVEYFFHPFSLLAISHLFTVQATVNFWSEPALNQL